MFIVNDNKEYKYGGNDNTPIEIKNDNELYIGDNLIKKFYGRSKEYCNDILTEISQTYALELIMREDSDEHILTYELPN